MMGTREDLRMELSRDRGTDEDSRENEDGIETPNSPTRKLKGKPYK